MRHASVQEASARAAAEDILQLVFGDDLQGCWVSLDEIIEIVDAAIRRVNVCQDELLSLHEGAAEAFQLLATPPAGAESLHRDALHGLLAERLDTIRTLSAKLVAATGAARSQISTLPS